MKHASDTVKAVAGEVCLPLLWQLAEMSEIEDAACLEFFTEGANLHNLLPAWLATLARRPCFG